MDVGAEFTIPNPYALLAADFNHDMDSYRAALGFLSDLTGGSDHDYALSNNGGSTALLTAWKGSPKFRRVYAKCRAGGAAERKALAERGPQPEGSERPDTAGAGRRFVPIADMPISRSVFVSVPSSGEGF